MQRYAKLLHIREKKEMKCHKSGITFIVHRMLGDAGDVHANVFVSSMLDGQILNVHANVFVPGVLDGQIWDVAHVYPQNSNEKHINLSYTGITNKLYRKY